MMRMVPLLLGFVVLSIFALTLSCGGPPAGIQRTLTVTARALVAANGPLTERYRGAADACYVQAETRSAYNTCVAAWDRAVDALAASSHALRMAQLGHDAWGGGSFERAAPCLASALIELLAALDAVGLEIPDALQQATSLVQPMAEGACNG